jgi:uncharacterized protein
MTISLYTASVPLFKQMLTSLGHVLRKAQDHAEAKAIEPAALLQARLFPDMFPLVRQVQIACDFASGITARIAGVAVPSMTLSEASFAGLQSLITATLAFLDTVNAAQIDGQGQREIVLRPGTQKEKTYLGQAYLLNYGLPQFFFHVTTSYAILRHNGVEVGKKDYMGL